MQTFAIVVTTVAAIAFGIAGIVFMAMATGDYVESDEALRSMIAGGVLVTLSVFLLITSAIMAFVSSWRKRT